MKKITQFIVAVLCFCAFTNQATAQFSGDGSSSNPYLITSPAELAQLATLVNAGNNAYNKKCYKLNNNIDISAYQTGAGWIPIGKMITPLLTFPFGGVFDGNDKKITGLFIDDLEIVVAGLFGYVESGTIKNLGVENASIKGGFFIGGVAGYCVNNSYLINCYSTGEIKGEDMVGGVAGFLEKSNITNCYSISKVSGESGIGGVAGELENSNITNCYFIGEVYSEGAAGGVVGRLNIDNNLSNCHAAGKVTGNDHVGGVAGYVHTTNLSNCYATCNVYGNDMVGGVAGLLYNGDMTNCYATGNVSGHNSVGGVIGEGNSSYELSNLVKNCYALGKVTGNASVGGVAGMLVSCHISHSYSTGEITGKDTVGGIAGYLDHECQVANSRALNPSVKGTGTLVGRVAGGIWYSTLSNNAAWDGMLNNSGNTNWNHVGSDLLDGTSFSTEFINEDGTLGGLFVTAEGWTSQNGKLPGFEQVVEMPLHLQLHNGTETDPYIITSAQQLAQLAIFVNSGNTAYNDKYYKLGNNISLSGYQTGTGWTPIGTATHRFAGNFDGNNKKITELYINNPIVELAGLFGFIDGGNVKNLGIEEYEINGNEFVGGMAARCWNGSLTNCYSTGKISGNNYVGGLVGNLFDGSASNCYSAGEVNGHNSVGGFAGQLWSAEVIHCYSISKITGNTQVGGIVGESSASSNIESCVALNPSVTGSGNAVGRVSGTKNNSTLSNNAAWDGILNNDGEPVWFNIGIDQLDGVGISKTFINADGTLDDRFTTTNGWTTQTTKLPGLFGETVAMPPHLFVPIPPHITTETLPNGVLGTEYSATLVANGSDPITWSLENGALPPGLNLYENGKIIGIPETTGKFNFTVKALNSEDFDTKALSINIAATGVIETHGTASLRVYPNPTNGQLTMDNGELTMDNVKIYDISGKTLNNCQFSMVNSQLNIDISHFPAGIYFLKIAGETVKVVKIN